MRQKKEVEGWRWALPPTLRVPSDELQARIDVFSETVVLRLYENGVATTRPVSALDVARAFFAEIPLGSGILPERALWWCSSREGIEVALWVSPGLVFICQSGRPPKVFAAKRRPMGPKSQLYHAPLFNVFQDGRTCAGTQHYGSDMGKHPWEFMTSFFTEAAHVHGRSMSHPRDLAVLWEELDGKRRYPLGDLVPFCLVEEVAPTGGAS